MDKSLDRISACVRQFPDNIAVSDPSRELTYAEFDADTDRLAHRLAARAEKPNAVIAYLGGMAVEAVVLNVAASKAGLALIALNATHPDAANEELFVHAGAEFIVTTEALADQARGINGAEPMIFETDVPNRGDVPVFTPVEVSPQALHFISYTSGSTGKPKGVPVTRAITDYRCGEKVRLYGTDEHDKVSTVNTFWWYKQIWPLTVGAEVACIDFASVGIRGLEDWMRSKEITVFSTYVAMCRELLQNASGPIPSVKQVIVGGEPVRVEDVRLFDKVFTPGCVFMIKLACQELNTVAIFTHKHGDPIDYEKVPLGKITRPEFFTLRNEDGVEVMEGEVGEIVASGPLVPPGYHDDAERTAAAFKQEEDGTWTYWMGDLARIDKDGVLQLLGRKDHQVKIRGYNVRPHEVEEKLEHNPAIRRAAVIPFRGDHGPTRLSAYLIAEPGHEISVAEVRSALSERVPHYQVPSFFFVRDALPLNAAGKLNRLAFDPIADIEAEKARTGDVAVDGTETEKTLAEIWKKVLQHGDFRLEDDFHDVGGDSLQAMSMLLEIELQLGVRLGMESLSLDGASIRGISQRIDEIRAGTAGLAAKRLSPGTETAPLFAVHVRGGHLSDYLGIVELMGGRHPIYGLHPRGMHDERAPLMDMEGLAVDCADTIMEMIEPGEPIRLMGFSFGGMLAYETAQVLAARGRPASQLVLLDPPAPWTQKPVPLSIVADYIKGQRTGLTVGRAIQTLRAFLHIGGTPDNLDEAHFVAGWRYRPKKVVTPVPTLLVSATREKRYEDFVRVWRDVLGPTISHVELPADHMSLVRAPLVRELSGIIDDWLEDDGTATPEAAPEATPEPDVAHHEEAPRLRVASN